MAAEGRHGCALTASGTVLCWGAGSDGGFPEDGADHNGHHASLRAELSHVVAVAAGEEYTGAVGGAGRVWCWGLAGGAHLGDADIVSSSRPRLVPGIDDAVRITADGSRACVLRRSGAVSCWGANDRGQAGGPLALAVTPTEVEGITGTVSVAAGRRHTCAAFREGSVRCWGGLFFGRLGPGRHACMAALVAVVGLGGARSASGGVWHTCVSTVAGVRCWGANGDLQLGVAAPLDRDTPGPVVKGWEAFVSLVAGAFHTY